MKSLRTIVALVSTLACTVAAQQPAVTGRYQVRGTLVNSVSGDVVRNAFVQLIAASELAEGPRSEVGADGTFAFHDVAPGKYRLRAQAPGFPSQLFEEHENFTTAIVVGPDKNSTGIVFRMNPQAAISGRVLDEHNEPVRDAQVWLFHRGNEMGHRVIEGRRPSQTDDLGEYRFGHLEPGTYYLVVSAQPWYRRYLQGGYLRRGANQQSGEIDPALDVAYPLIYYPGATDSDGAGAIVLRPGDRISADFNLMPVQSLHLTVRTDPGVDSNQPPPQPNFRQIAFGQPIGFQQPNLNYQQGEMEISGIAPGNYDLNIFHFDQKGTSRRRQSVTLGQSGDLDITGAAALAPIHGVLKFDGAAPEQNLFLQFRDLGSGNAMGARVDEHGEFTVEPEIPGRYVAMLGNAAGYAIRSVSATGARVSGGTIEVTGAQPVELSIEVSRGIGTINGTVMDGDKAISGTMVVLVPDEAVDNASLFRRDQSDSDGTFTLRDVVPGRYTAIAIRNGWDLEWGSPEVLRPYLAHGTVVQIGSKQQLEIRVAAQ